MMCDSSFSGPSLTEIGNDQDRIPVGQSIEELSYNAGAIFQHEMMHYISEGSELIQSLGNILMAGLI